MVLRGSAAGSSSPRTSTPRSRAKANRCCYPSRTSPPWAHCFSAAQRHRDRGRICPAMAARSQLCSADPAGAENPRHERILQNHLRTCPRHLPGNRRPPGTSRSTALLQQLLCVGCPHTGWPEPGASGQAEPLTGSLQVQENSAVQAEHGAVLPIKRISLLKRKRLGKGPAPGSVEMCQPLLWHQGRHLGGCI